MEFQALKADLLALPAGQTLSQQLAAMQALTVTATNQPFTLGAAKTVARQAATGDWSLIVLKARSTTNDAATLAAINVTEGHDADIIDPTIAATWQAIQAGLSALNSAGLLSSASVSAINALTTVTTPKYPGITVGDIQTAQGQP